MRIFFIGILFLILSGFIATLFKKEHKTKVVTIFGVIGLLMCLSTSFYPLWQEAELIKVFTSLLAPIAGNVVFSIDLLSSIFVSIISIIGILSLIYSNGYLKPYLNSKNITSHLIFFPILIASMLLVITCKNALLFLICWEIMSLSSFFLVIFENEKKEVLKAGIKYLIFMHISVIFIILAFAIASIHAGSFDFEAFKEILIENNFITNIVFGLSFAGFATKAGFVPFHNWLPDAHPQAPTHISAIMSGVMIKTGIYGILRMISLISIPSKTISYTIFAIGIISALYGILYALSQKDIKKLLAYCSIENIGIIGIGIGLGMLGLYYNDYVITMLGFTGAILHTINHALFKTLLFFGAGNIYLKTHTKNIELLGGLMKVMPITGLLFLIGSVAICALPPFNGFISEIIIYIGLLSGLGIHNFTFILVLIFGISSLALVGTLAILCFTKAFSIIFLGEARSEQAKEVNSDTEKTMTIPMSSISIIMLLIGIFPPIIFKYVQMPVIYVVHNTFNFLTESFEEIMTIYFQNTLFFLQIISAITIIFIIFTTILILIKKQLTKGKIEEFETWGCGYNRANNKMQYSASSYINPLTSMFKPLFKNIFDIEKPRNLFPKSAHFSMRTDDIEEAYLINPLVKFDEWFLSKFETIQSGNIQSYIIYSLIFLLLIIIGSVIIG